MVQSGPSLLLVLRTGLSSTNCWYDFWTGQQNDQVSWHVHGPFFTTYLEESSNVDPCVLRNGWYFQLIVVTTGVLNQGKDVNLRYPKPVRPNAHDSRLPFLPPSK